MLNLSDALKLYDLIGQYLPDIISDDPLDYIKQIIDNILDGDNQVVYIEILSLLHKYSQEDLLAFDETKLLSLFITGLTETQILPLQQFCKGLGYA